MKSGYHDIMAVQSCVTVSFSLVLLSNLEFFLHTGKKKKKIKEIIRLKIWYTYQ